MTEDIRTTHATAAAEEHGETSEPTRTFRRSRTDRMLAGVCAGTAELLGIDASIVRVLTVLATLLGFGTGIVLYLACWLIVPEQP